MHLEVESALKQAKRGCGQVMAAVIHVTEGNTEKIWKKTKVKSNLDREKSE